MRLFAKINDAEILLKSLNVAGTAFYRPVKKNIVEAVYFSGSRTIYFLGELTPRQYEALKGQAYEAKSFRINEQQGTIEVSQLEGE